MSFITIRTPDGSIWADQEYFIRKDLISVVRLTKSLTNAVTDGVTIYTENQGWQRSFFVRCPSFDTATLLYQEIKGKLSGSDT